MSYCTNCGAKLPEEANFCVECGKKQTAEPVVKKKEKPPVHKRWWFWVLIALFGISFLPSGGNAEDAETKPEETAPVLLAFLDGFTEYGYTVEQIQNMKTVLLNVGISDITDLKIQPVVSGMQVIKGKVSNKYRKDIDVQVNIENGVVYLVTIYCSNFWTSLSGLTDERADLYYDVDGGYLRKIDWENKAVVDY